MATIETIHRPQLGEQGERCAGCEAELAPDQRYCLNCGRRRAHARLPFLEVLADRDADGRPAGAAPSLAPAGAPGPRSVTPLAAVTAVSAVVVALAAGVVIGHQGDGSKAAKPQVISVAGGGPAAAAAPVAKFVDDWPKGKNGYTVQLQVLPKDSTQPPAVAAAKTAAQGKGAADAGALDSDSYASLDGGNYVVYSGVFDKQKDAQAALAKVKKSFPGAKVVKVSAGGDGGASQKGDPNALNGKTKSATLDRSQLKGLHSLPPSEYQKKAAKLPDETKLPGKPPPTDNKAPGGGSGAGASG